MRSITEPITDRQIEAVVLSLLSERKTAGTRNGTLLSAVQDAAGSYRLQLRRVQRIAGEMCDRGDIICVERGAEVTVYPRRGPYKKMGDTLWVPKVAFYYLPEYAPQTR